MRFQRKIQTLKTIKESNGDVRLFQEIGEARGGGAVDDG